MKNTITILLSIISVLVVTSIAVHSASSAILRTGWVHSQATGFNSSDNPTNASWGTEKPEGAFLSSQNTQYNTTVGITQMIARQSNVKFAGLTTDIGASGDPITEIRIINNTRDGCELYVESGNGYRLTPIDTKDGEEAISYTLNVKSVSGPNQMGLHVSGTGNNMDGAAGFAGKNCIVRPKYAHTGQPTDMTLIVGIKFDSIDIERLGLAGTYTDTITYTFLDL